MIFREAGIEDIAGMQVVRHAVKENVLSDPALVTDNDCEEYILHRGKGWVGVTGNEIVGFAIADLKGHSIWALFIQPEWENKGIGKALHNIMLQWYFTHTRETVWLSTAPGTRAAVFYRKQGWAERGMTSSGELKFEMTHAAWLLRKG